MNKRRYLLFLAGCLLVAITLTHAQFRGGRRAPDPQNIDRGNIPNWELDPEFPQDCFTFARIKYSSPIDRTSYAWWTDYADADLNMSFRIRQLTSMPVHPNGKVVEITDPELFDYPFVFMSGVAAIVMSDEEADILRKYLLNGGFMMVDDFWGERTWDHFHGVIKQIFPDLEPEELPMEHPIFSFLFPLKEKPQIPNVGFAVRNRGTGVTWEVPDGRTPHYRGIHDRKGRLMVLICHNTDLGDGWEEEGTDEYYFREFSEKKAYPLGFNIILYAMTH